jgi:hypothetical protein
MVSPDSTWPPGELTITADVAFAFGIGKKLGGDPLGHLHVHFAEHQHGARLVQGLGDFGGLGVRARGFVFLVVFFFVGAAHGISPGFEGIRLV